LTEPSSNTILKRNTKQQKSIFFKKVFIFVHISNEAESLAKPPTVLPLFADQIQFPPGGGASNVFPPPSSYLPLSINQPL
jgi:hypothetical protein